MPFTATVMTMFHGVEGAERELRPMAGNPDGTPMLPSTVSDTFRRQVAKSGLPVMRLHDARHTHLTHLLRSGEPIQNVSARAGHGSSFTTLTTYAHVIAGDDERFQTEVMRLAPAPKHDPKQSGRPDTE